jgi:bacterioferritin (cytochrome b1)
MSRPNVIDVLNRLLANQCYSLVNYLSEAPPWTRPGNEELVHVILGITQDREHYAQRLAEAIYERDGGVDSGLFPMTFMSLNDLALDYLLAKLIENQQRDIQAAEQCVAELVEDPLAWSLASEVLGSERAHLDILKEFLPKTERLPNGDKIRSQAA